MTQFGWRGTDPDGSPSAQLTGAGKATYVQLDPMPENGTLDSVEFHNAFDDTSEGWVGHDAAGCARLARGGY